jgi:hypothetical protein
MKGFICNLGLKPRTLMVLTPLMSPIFYLCFSLCLSFCLFLVSCTPKQPLRKRVAETRIPTCEEANRLAYRAVTSTGYAAAGVQIAKPGQPGYIEAKKEDGKTGKVVITCADESHATAEPDRTGEPVRVLVGAADKPGSFPHVFTQTYNAPAHRERPNRGLSDSAAPNVAAMRWRGWLGGPFPFLPCLGIVAVQIVPETLPNCFYPIMIVFKKTWLVPLGWVAITLLLLSSLANPKTWLASISDGEATRIKENRIVAIWPRLRIIQDAIVVRFDSKHFIFPAQGEGVPSQSQSFIWAEDWRERLLSVDSKTPIRFKEFLQYHPCLFQ